MRGWCPRCDAVREAAGTCPECQAPLVDLEERPIRPAARQDEAAAEVGAVVEAPPRGRLRVALAVAAVVLVGLAFVAGRGTGGTVARTASRSTSATTQTTAQPADELQRQLGWRSKRVNGIQVEAVSVSRIPSDTVNGDTSTSDNDGSLTLRVDGLAGGRRLLGITGLLSASATEHGQLELSTDGVWPARPPMRAVASNAASVSVPVIRADGGSGEFPLQVSSAFVGAGRVVLVLSFDEQVAGRDLGIFPISVNLRDGRRVVCSRLTVLGLREPQISPLLVVDCPTSPAARLTVDLAAGVEPVRSGATLSA